MEAAGAMLEPQPSLFPFAAYLKLDSARLFSWQSLRVLATVAVAVANLEGSSFGKLTNTSGERGGSPKSSKIVTRLTTKHELSLMRVVTPGVT